MSDPRFPDLPSDEELGITEEDVRAFEAGTSAEPASAPPASPGARPPAAGTPGGTGGPRRAARFRGPVTLLVLLAAGWLSSIRTGLPDPVPATAPDTAFSSARAMDDLIEIARVPRPTGSPEHARVREWIVARLDSLGLAPEIQTATAVLEGPGFARAATVRNVVARIPGTDPTGAVVLTAHYDGVPLSPAAGDDGSGVVTVLETARALLAGPAPRNDVLVLLTDAEEVGLLGARAFVDGHPWATEARIVLSFEMRGAAGPSIMFRTSPENGWAVRELRDAWPGAFATSLGDAFFRYLPNATDFTVFEAAGVPGLDFAAIDEAAVYHTPRDVPSRVLEATLQHHGLHALSAARRFAAVDLGATRAPPAAYFSLPVLGLVVHPVAWSIPLAVLIAAGWVGLLLLARRRGARLGAVVVGVGVSIVALALAWGAGIGLLELVRPAHAEAGRLPGSLLYGEGWYLTALAAAAVLVASLTVWIARRWLSAVEMALAGTLVPAAGAVVLAAIAPPAAPILQWPVLVALLVLVALVLARGRASRLVGWALPLVSALAVLAFLLPAAELLWLAASLGAAGAICAFAVAALLLVAPLLDALRAPNAWWLPAACVVTAAAAFGMGRLGAEVSSETPLPSTLLWVRDPEGVGTLWASTPDAPEAVVAWREERGGGAFDRTVDLSGIGYLRGDAVVREAPTLALPAPELVVLADTTLGLVRRLTLGVRSRIGAEMIHFARPGRDGARIVHVGGVPLARPEELRWIEHWGEPDSLVAVGLEVPPGASLDLVIAEHHLRAPELLGPGTFARPPELVADALRASDRAISVTRFRPTPGQPSGVPPDAPGAPGASAPSTTDPPTP